MIRTGRLRRELNAALAEIERRRAERADLLGRLSDTGYLEREAARDWAAQWLRGRAEAYRLDAAQFGAKPEDVARHKAVSAELEQLAIDLTHRVSA